MYSPDSLCTRIRLIRSSLNAPGFLLVSIVKGKILQVLIDSLFKPYDLKLFRVATDVLLLMPKIFLSL